MIKYAARKLALALTLVVLMDPVGRAFAQSTTPPPPSPPITTTPSTPTPASVTGTDPEPQNTVVYVILFVLGMA